MIDPKELAKGGFGAAAARRREREAQRATERRRDAMSPVPVSDTLPEGTSPRDVPAAPAPERPIAPAGEAASDATKPDETTQRPDAQ
jgi:hypothetical protein